MDSAPTGATGPGATGPSGPSGLGGTTSNTTVLGAIDATAAGTGPLTVDCGTGNHATGGGAVQRGTFVVGDHLISSYPSTGPGGTPVTSGTVNPQFWTSRYEPHDGGTTDGWNVFVLCTPNP